VAFDGTTDWGRASRLPFHVSSRDWQESHRFLAGIMTMVAAPTASVPLGGVGEIGGVMVGDLGNPRVEGSFTGRAMRAWNVSWGARGLGVIENSRQRARRRRHPGSGAHGHDGQFALGYPRRTAAPIDGRIRVGMAAHRLPRRLRTHDYPWLGALGGEIRLNGRYEEPFGFGRLTLDRGLAYDEPFASGVTSLRFEGPGVRLDGLEVKKAGSTITGAAYVAWAGTYSFNADGRRLAVDALDLTYFPTLPPLTGFADFSAAGSGTFEEPRYDVKVNVPDLFIGEEGIGDDGAGRLRA
jgi:hypothetical protein